MTQVTRDAVATDIPDIINVGMDLVKDVMGLRPDRDKLKKVLEVAMSSKAQKLLVATENGKFIGAMLTVSHPFMYAEKAHAFIVGIWSIRTGAANAMLDITMEWVKSRKAVQMCCYSMTVKTKLDEILLNYDFEPSGSMLVWRRYELFQ